MSEPTMCNAINRKTNIRQWERDPEKIEIETKGIENLQENEEMQRCKTNSIAVTQNPKASIIVIMVGRRRSCKALWINWCLG